MSSGIPGYVERLGNISPTAKLNQRVKKLTQAEQSALITDVLQGNAPQRFAELIREDESDYVPPPFFTPEEVALNWLAKCDKSWLDKHANVIEKIFENALFKPDGESKECYSRILLLVEHSRAGLTTQFLERLLADESLQEHFKIETEIYLLIAKIKEAEDQLDLSSRPWSNIDLQNRPWLLAVLLYVYRNEKLSNVLKVFWDFDEAWEKGGDNFEGEMEEVRPYVVSYFRQALFKGLSNAKEEEYSKYFSFETNIKKGQWLGELIEEVRSNHTMKKIQSRLAQHVQESHKEERKQTHNEKIQSIEKDIFES